jgi:hypothetical protein
MKPNIDLIIYLFATVSSEIGRFTEANWISMDNMNSLPLYELKRRVIKWNR